MSKSCAALLLSVLLTILPLARRVLSLYPAWLLVVVSDPAVLPCARALFDFSSDALLVSHSWCFSTPCWVTAWHKTNKYREICTNKENEGPAKCPRAGSMQSGSNTPTPLSLGLVLVCLRVLTYCLLVFRHVGNMGCVLVELKPQRAILSLGRQDTWKRSMGIKPEDRRCRWASLQTALDWG